MPSLTIKNIPRSTYLRLKEMAGAHRRSLNSEAIVCLEQALGMRSFEPEAFLREIDELRESLTVTPLDGATIRAMKAQGRP